MKLASANDRGHIEIDFAVKELDLHERKAVKHLYPNGEINEQFSKYVAVAVIQDTGEYLIVPEAYGQCSIRQKTKYIFERPIEFKNSEGVQKIIGVTFGETCNKDISHA